MLLLSFTVKLTIVTLFYSIPATQTNRLQLVLNSTARAVTKTLKLHHITPILKSLQWLKIKERIKYKVLSLTYKFIKTVNLLTSALFSFPSHRCTRSSLITLSRTALTSRLKIANRSYHSAPVLWNNLLSDLRHVAHHFTSPVLNSPVSDLSTSLFLKKWKPISFTLNFAA